MHSVVDSQLARCIYVQTHNSIISVNSKPFRDPILPQTAMPIGRKLPPGETIEHLERRAAKAMLVSRKKEIIQIMTTTPACIPHLLSKLASLGLRVADGADPIQGGGMVRPSLRQAAVEKRRGGASSKTPMAQIDIQDSSSNGAPPTTKANETPYHRIDACSVSFFMEHILEFCEPAAEFAPHAASAARKCVGHQGGADQRLHGKSSQNRADVHQAGGRGSIRNTVCYSLHGQQGLPDERRERRRRTQVLRRHLHRHQEVWRGQQQREPPDSSDQTWTLADALLDHPSSTLIHDWAAKWRPLLQNVRSIIIWYCYIQSS